MKKILIPTDFSKNSNDAIKFAFTLFGDQAIEINLLNVVGIEMMEYPEAQIVNQEKVAIIQKQSNRLMVDLVENIKQKFDCKNKIIKTYVQHGTIVKEINDFAVNNEIELIIMGTQGENHNLAEKLIGTISTAMLNNLNCPTVLVPPDFEVDKIDDIVYATNLEKGDAFELWKVLRLLKPSNPIVRCLHIKNDNSKMNASELALFAKFILESSNSIQTIFNIEHKKNVSTAINEYIQDYDAKMLVMHKSKKSVFSKIFGLSQTIFMVHKLKVPLLVMN